MRGGGVSLACPHCPQRFHLRRTWRAHVHLEHLDRATADTPAPRAQRARHDQIDRQIRRLRAVDRRLGALAARLERRRQAALRLSAYVRRRIARCQALLVNEH